VRISFEPTDLTGAERALQREVREFLSTELPPGSYERGLGMASAKDRAFSGKLAERGWVGMALPAAYGGGGRSAMDRFVVVEELLRWGAPLGHHWVADRQTGPMILRYGSEEQKRRFLPAIARAEVSFSIGMSEPDSGSDLASVATRAVPCRGGWSVSGRKLWTSGAAENDWMTVLCRTSVEDDRHAGLTQLLVELSSPGLTINPITFIDGTSGFNEVVLDDVFVPENLVLGEIGGGWRQIGSELAFERGGPDRWLSSYGVVEELLRTGLVNSDTELERFVGSLVARWWVIRRLSMSVARMIDNGQAPAIEAALVKSIGTCFEQDIVTGLAEILDDEDRATTGQQFQHIFARAILTSPSWTIRGGTSEVLRSIVARGM
jgi:alkylation response protein AidB-like acyl-CoA dehydrogenase